MPSCERSRKISAYHDGELPTEEGRELEGHIQQCPHCARELEWFRSLSGLFAAAGMPEMSSDALDRLHGRIGSVREVFVLRMAEKLMAAAATLLVGCAIWFWQTARVEDSWTAAPERWEIAAVSLQTEAAEASAEDMLAQWIVSDLSRENERD